MLVPDQCLLNHAHHQLLFTELIDAPGNPNDNVAVKKARKLYNSCMHNSFRTSHYSDYKYLPIFSVLNRKGIGNWPILQGASWNSSEFNLEYLLSQLFIHQVQNIFKLYVSPDETDPTKYLLEVRKFLILIVPWNYKLQQAALSCLFAVLQGRAVSRQRILPEHDASGLRQVHSLLQTTAPGISSHSNSRKARQSNSHFGCRRDSGLWNQIRTSMMRF